MFNKKGESLSLNTIIIAIIVVVVLVAVVMFFLFGFKGVTDRIKGALFGTAAGNDKSLSIQLCRQYCDQASMLPKSLIEESPYCTYSFKIDEDSNGEAEYIEVVDAAGNTDKQYIRYYCSDRPNLKNTGLKLGDPLIKPLDVGCPNEITITETEKRTVYRICTEGIKIVREIVKDANVKSGDRFEPRSILETKGG